MARKDTITAQSLLDEGLSPELPREFIRKEVQRRIRYYREKGYSEESILQSLYPNTIVEFETLESLTTALLSGTHTLFFGPPGSGKTNLAKDIWNLFKREIWVVDGCPVHDDPFSIIDERFSKIVPPCPFCKMTYGGMGSEDTGDFQAKLVSPSSVPVKKMMMREGFGLARIQGSPEIFPDNLTGTINLHKLEEVGDPTSPLVLEPGKLLQANRGLLMVDEIGKLPIGTQNVLLQALQEHIVTPGKSRGTFPASFIAITTSNLEDLENINEPLKDRLTNIYISFCNEHAKNRRIVDIALRQAEDHVFIPQMFVDAGVFLIEAWRRTAGGIYEFSEVGSNRTMIDIITRAEAYTALRDKPMMSVSDFKRGALDAMHGKIRMSSGESFAQNTLVINNFAKKHLDEELKRAGSLYWCGFYESVLNNDKPEGLRVIEECRMVSANPEKLAEASQPDSPHKKFSKFLNYAQQEEKYLHNLSTTEAVTKIFLLLDSLEVFSCEKQ